MELRTPWVVYINQNYFNSHGCKPPQKLSRFNIKRIGLCLNSENVIQGLTSKSDSCFPAYCFYIMYLTKVLGIDFKLAVINLYSQRFSLYKRHCRKWPMKAVLDRSAKITAGTANKLYLFQKREIVNQTRGKNSFQQSTFKNTKKNHWKCNIRNFQNFSMNNELLLWIRNILKYLVNKLKQNHTKHYRLNSRNRGKLSDLTP